MEMNEKEFYKKLAYKTKNVYEQLSADERREMMDMCDEYRVFLDAGKTERECVNEAVKMAEANGFVPFKSKDSLKPGDRIYFINRKKNILLAVIGERDIEEGVNIVGAHIDSPRLDLKQNPLYQSKEMALLKTHYYGGIKKYQWTAMPLAIHGVAYTKDGEQVEICIGEREEDPVFCITDLLPHLAKDQMAKKLGDAIEGESLNILIGGMGINGSDIDDSVKYNVLNILNITYGITEESFLSAELELVPSQKAKNVGIDNSFVGAYGQDDRVCAFTAMKSIFEVEIPQRTAMCLLVDKEEIGSTGNTGMLSKFFDMAVAELIEKLTGKCDMVTYNRVIRNSACMSSDVSAAVDPNYESAFERQNSSYAGRGMALMKYTGSRGKSGASDASAEFVHEIVSIMNKNNVVWQTCELGKVDQGGGGTIAMYVANLNMDVIDCGVPVLSMHSPFEVTAKGDIYMAYKAYAAFYKDR
ncbi:MAG: aminopeptidase [Clostridia bacterium]|nr:aminopeptidase [Clostridia bacterium]